MDHEELIKKINDIRKIKAYYTNAFFTMPQLNQLLEKDGTQVFESEGLILLAEEQKDLLRIYLFA